MGQEVMATKDKASVKEFNTPYDDVFRTLLNDCESLILPVLNEVFDEEYTGDEEIVQHKNEHFMNRQDGEDKRITDSSITVIGKETKNYLFECQSRPDSSMLVRIFEYATQIAVDSAKREKNKLEVTIPHSAVLYLRSTKSTPDEMQIKVNAPSGDMVLDVPIMKVSSYSLDDIFRKKLLFLIPFYIFNFEGERCLNELERDAEKLERLKDDYRRIVEHLDRLTDEEKLSAYYRMTILEMTRKVVDGVTAHHEKVREGVKEIMGGTVLEYRAKTIYREGETSGYTKGEISGYTKGEISGYTKGETSGYTKGDNARARRTASILKDMGMPMDQIAKAVESTVAQVEEWLSPKKA